MSKQITGVNYLSGTMGLNKIIIFIFFLVNISTTYAQNLVPNGDFEEHGFIGSLRSLGNLHAWRSPNSSTPDYLSNKNKKMTPFGEHFCGILIQIDTLTNLDDVEYLSVKLQNVLSKGQRYCISLYALRDAKTYFSLKNLTYVLSKERISNKGIGFINMNNYDSFKYKDTLIKEKSEWMYMCSQYIANGDEKYLTIGYFSNKPKLYKVDKGRPSSYITYYYIDNVSLIPLDNNLDCNCGTVEVEPTDSLVEKIRGMSLGDKIVLDGIYFETNKSDLMQSSNSMLQRLISILESDTNMIIEISGHTDSIGSASENMILSESRAKAVAKYLLDNGIQPNRIKWKGYGSLMPIADNDSYEGRKRNRRVEFKVIDR